MSEEAAKVIVFEIYRGLLYLSKMNVVHCNLNIDNIFLVNGKIKIGGLGCSKRLDNMGF